MILRTASAEIWPHAFQPVGPPDGVRVLRREAMDGSDTFIVAFLADENGKSNMDKMLTPEELAAIDAANDIEHVRVPVKSVGPKAVMMAYGLRRIDLSRVVLVSGGRSVPGARLAELLGLKDKDDSREATAPIEAPRFMDGKGGFVSTDDVPVEALPYAEALKRATFKVGDVVWLNSGSPAMTVVKVLPYGDSAECHWITRDGQVRNVQFPAVVLTQNWTAGLGYDPRCIGATSPPA